jgi:hypothetical protein
MKFLNIRREKQERKDGTKPAKMYFEEKSKKFGSLVSSKYISNRKNILISGGFQSGKSRIIFKIWTARKDIFGANRGFVKLSGLGTIAEFVDTPTLRNFYNSIPKGDNAELIAFFNANEGREFKNLRQHERIENLILYVKHNNTILVIDDANRLTNRKLEIAKRCIEHCKQFVIATNEEQKLATSLRTVVMNSNLEHIKLDTNASYDVTGIFVWLIVAAAAVGGWYELAFIMGGLKALSTGRGATRKD